MRRIIARRMIAAFLAPTLIMAPLLAQTQARHLAFVTCPIVRDTKSTPCWLAEYQGESYFQGVQGGVAVNFYPPQLSHEVLVEGTVVPGPRVCGGVPLRPVKISVLQELNAACRTMLPAEDGIEAPPRAPRGSPDSWLKVTSPASSTLYFDFDNDFLSLHAAGALQKAAELFRQSVGSTIEIASYRGASKLSNGKMMIEQLGMAEARANKVALILIGLGIAETALKIQAITAAPKANGVDDAWHRRVVLIVRR